MTDLSDLIARVRSGSGADRRLDCDIAEILGLPPRVPEFTASLDAVVRLVDENLGKGEAEWFVARDSADGPFHASVRRHTGTPFDDVSGSNPSTPARALLAALLTALQAQENER